MSVVAETVVVVEIEKPAAISPCRSALDCGCLTLCYVSGVTYTATGRDSCFSAHGDAVLYDNMYIA
jgi:hypothetical protein